MAVTSTWHGQKLTARRRMMVPRAAKTQPPLSPLTSLHKLPPRRCANALTGGSSTGSTPLNPDTPWPHPPLSPPVNSTNCRTRRRTVTEVVAAPSPDRDRPALHDAAPPVIGHPHRPPHRPFTDPFIAPFIDGFTGRLHRSLNRPLIHCNVAGISRRHVLKLCPPLSRMIDEIRVGRISFTCSMNFSVAL